MPASQPPIAENSSVTVPSMPAWPFSMPHRLMSVEITKVNTMKSSASIAQPPKAPMNVRRSVLFISLYHCMCRLLILLAKTRRGDAMGER